MTCSHPQPVGPADTHTPTGAGAGAGVGAEGLGLDAVDLWGGPHNDSVLYNAMISPLVGKTLRSVVWFQGEADVVMDTSLTYACRFANMINGWRDTWGLGDFAFNYV